MPSLRHIPDACGLDEAGRGTLAGPVVVAAVVLRADFDIQGLDDSKRLTPAERQALAERITKEAQWTVAIADVEEVDRKNVLWATMAAMERAVASLSERPKTILVDGDRVPPGIAGRAVVKGDSTYACIAAASILAKTHRDGLMKQIGFQYPEYGFESHFGYATRSHFQALREHGPCPVHRRTFAPVRQMIEQPCLALGV
jgi:ribonuclease HII